MDEASRKFLESSMSQLRELYPEFDEILEQAQQGEITQDEAFAQMAQKMTEDPERASQFLEQSLTTYQERFHHIEPIDLNDDLSPEELVIKPPVGLPRLHPMYEAAILERLQFDGDVPELRSGPLEHGGTPAVPVDTDARNPVMMGFLLELASTEVHRELKERQEEEYARLEASVQTTIAGHDPTVAISKSIETQLVESYANPEVDPDSYRRGEVPAPFKLHGEKPNGSTLAHLEPEKAQEFAWKAISTSQGRRSALPTIEKDVQGILEKAGFSVILGESENRAVLAEHSWTITLERGPASTQTNFSFIDVAGKAIAASLRRKLGDPPRLIGLEVSTINQVSDRLVGWGACAFQRDEV